MCKETALSGDVPLSAAYIAFLSSWGTPLCPTALAEATGPAVHAPPMRAALFYSLPERNSAGPGGWAGICSPYWRCFLEPVVLQGLRGPPSVMGKSQHRVLSLCRPQAWTQCWCLLFESSDTGSYSQKPGRQEP